MGMKIIHRNKDGKIVDEVLNVNYVEISAVDEETTVYLAPQGTGYKTYRLDDVVQIQAI